MRACKCMGGCTGIGHCHTSLLKLLCQPVPQPYHDNSRAAPLHCHRRRHRRRAPGCGRGTRLEPAPGVLQLVMHSGMDKRPSSSNPRLQRAGTGHGMLIGCLACVAMPLPPPPPRTCSASVSATRCTWSLSSPMGSTHFWQKVATSRSDRPCKTGQDNNTCSCATCRCLREELGRVRPSMPGTLIIDLTLPPQLTPPVPSP